MQALLEGLVPGLPDALREPDPRPGRGRPAVRGRDCADVARPRPPRCRTARSTGPTGEIETLEVPETLHALIAARLDGLLPEERRLLQDGAVLGKTFTARALATLSGLLPEELEPLLSSLVRKEVLGVQSDPRSPEHGQYGFLQDLVRHVAYETLSKRERKSRHLAAAQLPGAGLRRRGRGGRGARLPLPGRRRGRARRRGRRTRSATRRARCSPERASAPPPSPRHAEAQRYFEQAAELTDDAREQAALLEQAGQMAWRANVPDERESSSSRPTQPTRRLRRSAGRRVCPPAWPRSTSPKDTLRRRSPVSSRLWRALEAGAADADLADAAAQLGRFLILNGEDERAAPHLERALSLAEALDLPETLAQALNSKALLVMNHDRLYEAQILVEGALALALAHDLHAAALRSYNNLSVLVESSERWAESLDDHRARPRVGPPHRRPKSRVELARRACGALWLLGRWDEALAYAVEAQELAATSWVQSTMLEAVAIHRERGELEQARRVFAGLSLAAETEDVQAAAQYANAEAGLLRAEGHTREAFAAAERALAVRAELGVKSLIGKIALLEALEAAAALGDDGKIRELLPHSTSCAQAS